MDGGLQDYSQRVSGNGSQFLRDTEMQKPNYLQSLTYRIYAVFGITKQHTCIVFKE